jgi:hypothetical protein
MCCREVAMASLTYDLVRECLDNVDDAAGLWQIEGGKVFEHGKHVGNYSNVKRTSCGTHQQNVGMFWVTLFLFSKEEPPENMTLHGALNFQSGEAIGSVSAASTVFAARIGKHFKLGGTNTLTIA